MNEWENLEILEATEDFLRHPYWTEYAPSVFDQGFYTLFLDISRSPGLQSAYQYHAKLACMATI